MDQTAGAGHYHVTREQIEDGVVDIAVLRADPMWEHCPVTRDWHRRTPEFIASRAMNRAELPDQLRAAEIALARVLIDLELSLPTQVDGRPWASAEDGYPYIKIDAATMGGPRPSAATITKWLTRLAEYNAVTPGDTLWWRTRPQITAEIDFPYSTPTWRVWCRLRKGLASETLLANSTELTPLTPL